MKRALTKSSDKNVLEHELHFEFRDKYLMYIGIEHAHRFVYEKTSLGEHRTQSTVPGIKSWCDGNATLEISCCTFRFGWREMKQKAEKKHYENKFRKWKTKHDGDAREHHIYVNPL